MTVYTQSAPLVLTDTSGTFTIDFTLAGTQWVSYTPATDGSLDMQAPTGFTGPFVVYDDEDTQMQINTDDNLTLVWSSGQLLQIAITGTASTAFTWSYAARASSELDVVLDNDVVVETPGALGVAVFNGIGQDPITFSVIGPTTVMDFQAANFSDDGSIEDFTVHLPGLSAGDYVLRVESDTSGSEDVPFTVTEDALSWGDSTRAVPTPPTTTPSNRWRLYDMRDPDVTYTLTRNPSKWTGIHPPNNFTFENTTAPDGQMITWEAAARPWRMEFSGYIDTEEEYAQFVFWSQLRRRFWLVDHRNRSWLVTFEHFDAQAKVTPNVPWSHDYTMKTVIFMQGTD